MARTDRNDPLSSESFLFNHGLSRRTLAKAGAAGALGLMVGAPRIVPVAYAQSEVTGGPIEVGVFYEEGPWFDHAKKIGDSLQADFPGTEVKYTFANTASDPARFLRWQNGDPLDVDTGFWSNQAPQTFDWINNGFVQDMTEFLNQPLASGEVWKDTFIPAVQSFAEDSREGSTTPGSWWGVPFELVLMLMQYNKAIFDEFAITPPKTWPEFLDVCAQINEKGKEKGIKPICVSGPTFYYTGHWWDRLIQRVVGKDAALEVIYGEGHLRDNPGFLTAAQEMAKLKENDWLMEGYEGADFTTAQALFFQGKAAMIHMGSWLTAEMKDSIPADFQLGVFDFPQYPDGAGDQNAMFGTAQMWSIANPEKATSHEVNVPLAVEYLKRWTSKENQAERSEVLRMIPTVKDVASPPGITGMDEAIQAGANSEIIIYYYGIHWDTDLTNAWYLPPQAVFLGQMGPEDMIAAIDNNLDQYRELKQQSEG